ncbi:MAG: alanine racemase, partial [Clostridia bacterium]|nr:alanine racemase [Clostridia bacterium]
RVGRRLFQDAPDRRDAQGHIREVCSLQAFLTDIRPRKRGDAIGYGGKIVLDRDTRIGIISIGYGDGLDPALADVQAPVLVHGLRAPLLSCCMDQSLVDLGEIPASPGDPVTLFGPDEQDVFLSAQEVAGMIGCEGVDLTARLTPRVERVYLR